MRMLKEITIEVIKKCNSNCIYCSSLSKKDDIIELDIKLIEEIISFAKLKGCKEICLSGGEPLLKQDIIQIINEIIQNNLKVIIYTSGNANFKSLFSYIQKNDIIRQNLKLIFNYPSHNSNSFSQIVSDFNFSVDKLNEIISSCIQKKIYVEVHFVPNRLNIDYMYETVEFLKKIGVTKVSILRLVFQGRAESKFDQLSFDNDSFKVILDKIKYNLVDDSFKLRIGTPFSNYSNRVLKCSAGFNKLIVKWDGKVYPCEAFKEAPNHELFILGDLNIEKLEDIWSKSEDNLELKALKESNFYNCDICPAQNLYHHEYSFRSNLC